MGEHAAKEDGDQLVVLADRLKTAESNHQSFEQQLRYSHNNQEA